MSCFLGVRPVCPLGSETLWDRPALTTCVSHGDIHRTGLGSVPVPRSMSTWNLAWKKCLRTCNRVKTSSGWIKVA